MTIRQDKLNAANEAIAVAKLRARQPMLLAEWLSQHGYRPSNGVVRRSPLGHWLADLAGCDYCEVGPMTITFEWIAGEAVVMHVPEILKQFEYRYIRNEFKPYTCGGKHDHR